MISAIQEVRDACYINIGMVAAVILLIYQFSHFKQKRDIPSFCVVGVQGIFQRIYQNFVGSLSEDAKWYKKWLSKVLNFLSKDYLWLIIEIIVMSLLVQYNVSLNRPFGKLVGTGANYFPVLFIMIPLYILYCCVVGVNPRKQADWMAPSYPIALVFSKFACFCAGCCWGIEWEHGLYSYRNERYEVPTQLIEMFWALAIFIFMMFYKKKAKRGTLLPIYMILFCATRFCSEFFRREENVLGPFKVYHILCLIGIVEGIVIWIISNKLGDKIDAHFDKNYRGLIGFAVKKIKGINDDGTYTEKGAIRAEKIKQETEKLKKKIEKFKKKRKVKKRKAQIKF